MVLTAPCPTPRCSRQEDDAEAEGGDSRLVGCVRRVLPVSEHYDEGRFFTTGRNGRRLATPLLLVLIVIELTDLARPPHYPQLLGPRPSDTRARASAVSVCACKVASAIVNQHRAPRRQRGGRRTARTCRCLRWTASPPSLG